MLVRLISPVAVGWQPWRLPAELARHEGSLATTDELVRTPGSGAGAWETARDDIDEEFDDKQVEEEEEVGAELVVSPLVDAIFVMGVQTFRVS